MSRLGSHFVHHDIFDDDAFLRQALKLYLEAEEYEKLSTADKRTLYLSGVWVNTLIGYAKDGMVLNNYIEIKTDLTPKTPDVISLHAVIAEIE